MAVIRLASSPDSPTASAPWTLIELTMSRLTLPTSTIRTRSMVSASVTRNPSWNSASLPTRSISAPIWGPPPWTTTGSMPDRAHQHDVLGERGQGRRLVDGGVPRLGAEHVAAVLDHHHLAPEAADVGQRLDQHRGLVARGSPSRRRPGPAGSGAAASRRRPVLVDVAVAEVDAHDHAVAVGQARAGSGCRSAAPARWRATAASVVVGGDARPRHTVDPAVGDGQPVHVEVRPRPSRDRWPPGPSRGPRR